MNIDEALGEAVEKLKLAAADGRRVEAAQMQLINLADVLRSAGANWRNVSEAIRIGTLSFLHGCLEDDDIVIPCGDGFLVIFAKADAAHVTLRTEEIRELLIEYYLGQEGLERLQVRATRQTLPVSALQALAGDEIVVGSEPGAPKFMFAPVWHTQKQIIAAYFCTPMIEVGPRILYAYDAAFFDTGIGEGQDFLATDLQALEIVDARLRMPQWADVKPNFGAPVHASTMRGRASRIEYLRRLNQMFTPEYARRLSIRISEIPRGAPVTTIADWVGQLRGKVRSVSLQFHHSEPMTAQIESTGAIAAGFFPPRQLEHTADGSPLANHIRSWAAKLTQARMVLFLDDLPNLAAIDRAMALGANFLTSTALWPCVAKPGEVRHAPLPARFAR